MYRVVLKKHAKKFIDKLPKNIDFYSVFAYNIENKRYC